MASLKLSLLQNENQQNWNFNTCHLWSCYSSTIFQKIRLASFEHMHILTSIDWSQCLLAMRQGWKGKEHTVANLSTVNTGTMYA